MLSRPTAKNVPFKAKQTRVSAADYTNFRGLVLKKFARVREIRGKDAFEILVP